MDNFDIGLAFISRPLKFVEYILSFMLFSYSSRFYQLKILIEPDRIYTTYL